MATEQPNLKDIVFGDLDREIKITRTVLERLPEDQYKWKPHEKSMSLEQLALHVSHLPDWIRGTFASDELDVAAAPRPPQSIASRQELLEQFDASVAVMRGVLAKFDMANFHNTWKLKQGAVTIVAKPRPFAYRIWCMNHLIHHRGQLCLYLRLLNVPVPTVYFNTADEPEWVFE